MARLVVRVVEVETGAPVAYAVVCVDTVCSHTDASGMAVFELPAGTYRLKVRSPVHSPHSAPVTVPGEVTVRLHRVTL